MTLTELTHLLPVQEFEDQKQKQRSQNGLALSSIDNQPTLSQNNKENERKHQPTSAPNYAYDPTPGSKLLISPTPTIYHHRISSAAIKHKEDKGCVKETLR